MRMKIRKKSKNKSRRRIRISTARARSSNRPAKERFAGSVVGPRLFVAAWPGSSFQRSSRSPSVVITLRVMDPLAEREV
jgi:hypothetical protein